MIATVEVTDMTHDELKALLARAEGKVDDDDFKKLTAIVNSLRYLTELIGDDKTTLRRLRQILSHRSSEKASKVLSSTKKPNTDASDAAPAPDGNSAAPTSDSTNTEPTNAAPTSSEPTCAASPEPVAKPKRKGHGRNGVDAYAAAKRVAVAHDALTSGAHCPLCPKGRVYAKNAPRQLIRVVGQPLFQATIYELERFRCNACGDTFTADAPPGVGSRKYDASAAATIGQLKYGTGLPWYRMERLQAYAALPLPDATQWDIVEDASRMLHRAHREVIRQAAAGDVIYNDDTYMRILTLMKENEKLDRNKERTGMFTSGIVSVAQGYRVALFFTGRKHAGENFKEVLGHRAADLGPPIQMCDGLDRNLPGELETILGNCLVHGRRHFVNVATSFPEPCEYVIKALGTVYHNDATAREQGLDTDARLVLHQKESGPVMEKLHAWLEAKFANKEVEKNSSLGGAIAYMLKRWDRLTLFLRVPGAPLDSNTVERSLKKAILHRKNSMFYRTEHGARIGDIWMSLIYTCELNAVDPCRYLIALIDHPQQVRADPAAWMPWNYHDALAADTG